MTTDPVSLSPELPSLDQAADEATTLAEMLDYYRAVLARKGSGLSAEQLRHQVAPSDLSVGALIYHLALVEDTWFEFRFLGKEPPEPWLSADWEADEDWELHNAHLVSPTELFAQYEASIGRSRATFADAESLDALAARPNADGGDCNLRWIMVHMIEEYARHCGHADFIRQSIDGVVDD